jgi:hypothetical protein
MWASDKCSGVVASTAAPWQVTNATAPPLPVADILDKGSHERDRSYCVRCVAYKDFNPLASGLPSSIHL